MDVSTMQLVTISPWIVPVLSVFGSLITLGMVGIFAFIIRKIGDLDKRLISLEKTIASLGTVLELLRSRMHLEDQAEAFGKTFKESIVTNKTEAITARGPILEQM